MTTDGSRSCQSRGLTLERGDSDKSFNKQSEEPGSVHPGDLWHGSDASPESDTAVKPEVVRGNGLGLLRDSTQSWR